MFKFHTEARNLALGTLISVAVLTASPPEAHALFPGDCGKPLASGTLGAAAGPTSTDALHILRAGVGFGARQK